MDRRIWGRMPEHLLERVLSFLPIKSFIALRPTCKHFNSLMSSPSFVSDHSVHSPSSSRSSFILLSHPHLLRDCNLFNTALNSWRHVSLPVPTASLISSSNGLLCFSPPASSFFVVFNLLSRSLRRVSFPIYPFDFDLLTLVSSPAGYKVFALSSSGAMVYDSKPDAWRRYSGSPDPILNENQTQKRGVYHDRRLFFTTPEPFRVVGFDLESGRWERSEVRLPEGLTFTRLVSDGDRSLYLVGGVGANGISRGVKVWELREEGGGRWAEFEVVPELVCRKFLSVCYHNYEHVYCFWHEGSICVCCYTWPEILCCRVWRMTWHWLPKCPSLPEKWSCGFRWFPFKPELNAIV